MNTVADSIHVASFPGDVLIPAPKMTLTHAITIRASPDQVWPWLVQMGAGRGGWYSYDRIDNGGKPSAEDLIPSLQQLNVGDVMPSIPNTKDAFIVRDVHPGYALVLVVPVQSAAEEPDNLVRMNGPLRVSWALILESVHPQRTKLISRGRVSAAWLTPSKGSRAVAIQPIFIERVYGLLARLPWWLMVPIALAGHYVMEARMLHGIKRRAEAMVAGVAEYGSP